MTVFPILSRAGAQPDRTADHECDGPPAPASGLFRLVRAWRRLRAFSFPRRFPIIQIPNLPLALAFVSGQAARRLTGPAHLYAQAISYLSMAVWAYLELFEGVNWFRRLLGAFYVASTAIHLERALSH